MLELLNDLIWGKVLVIVLVGIGLFLTISSRAVQFRYFRAMFGILSQAVTRKDGQISSFQALMVTVGGRVGAGNIAGVAVAILLGGPGAVFWMWVVALLGMATSYFECSLAQLYKRRQDDGLYRGGPAFYMQYGLGQRWMGVVFSILLLVTFGFGFSALQSYTVATSLHDAFDLPTHISGLALAAIIAVIIFGGIKRITNMADILVPVMALSYISIALLVLLLNIADVPAMLLLIVKSAFGLEPALGGGIGAAIIMGVKRGLFSNEAGLGSAPNVAAVAEVDHPAAQGIVQAFSVFIDTILICTSTALIILLSGVYQTGAEQAGVLLTQSALATQVGEWGRMFVSLALLLFVFTTLIYNYYLGENALGFFTQNKVLQQIYRLLVVGLVFWGSLQDLNTVFGFADLTMGLLALFNLAALIMLYKVGIRLMRDYDAQVRRGSSNPVLDPSEFSDLNLDPKVWAAKQHERDSKAKAEGID